MSLMQFSAGVISGVVLGDIGLWISLVPLSLIAVRNGYKYAVFGLLIGAGCFFLAGPYTRSQAETFYGKTIAVQGEVVDVDTYGAFSLSITMRTAQLPGRILVESPIVDVQEGDSLIFSAKFVPVDSSLSYLIPQGVYLFAKPSAVSVSKNANTFQKICQGLRRKFIEIIDRNLPADSAKLLSGILIGDKQESFSPNLDLAFKQSGIGHILSVSGYKISLVVFLCLSLAGFIHRRRLLLAILLIVFVYFVFVGVERVSTARAVMFSAITILGQLSGRTVIRVAGILYVAAIMLLIDPLILNNLSFQLSFAAVLGIACLAANYRKAIPHFHKLIRENLVATLSVLTFLTPVLWGAFSQLSLVAIPLNLIVMPFVTYVFVGGFLAIMLSVCLPFLAGFVFWVINLPLSLMLEVINRVGTLPFASTTDPGIALGGCVLLLILGLLVDLLAFRRNIKKKPNAR